MMERVPYDSPQMEIAPSEKVQVMLEAAVYVVDMFDQANTGHSIETSGSRGEILKDAIERLRVSLNTDHQRTILTSEQAR